MDTLIRIGFYDPMTGLKDWSALPEMEWSGPMSAEEMKALVEMWCQDSKLN